MHLPVPIVLIAALAIAAPIQQQRAPTSDLCHVYVVDTVQAERLMNELLALPNPTEAQALALKKKYPDSEQILGTFEANVGEEVLTTKSYPVPGTRQFVTASVYYTDEAMRSSGSRASMSVSIVVSPRRHENALTVDNNSTSQISYNGHADKIQVTTRARIGGRLKVIGLECQVRTGTPPPPGR